MESSDVTTMDASRTARRRSCSVCTTRAIVRRALRWKQGRAAFGPPSERRSGVDQRTTSTLHGACCTTLELTEPRSHRCAPLRPRVPMTIMSASSFSASSMIICGGVALALDDLRADRPFSVSAFFASAASLKALLLLLGHEHRARAAELRQRLGHADNGDIGAVAFRQFRSLIECPVRTSRIRRMRRESSSFPPSTSFQRKRRAADIVLHPRRTGKASVFSRSWTRPISPAL